jgi:hypothetical protein
VHGFANVDYESGAKIGFFFVLLDVKPVRLGPDLPIQMAKIVTGNIFPVLHKLDAMAEERAPVHAGQKTFDHLSRPKFQRGQAGNGLRVKKAARIVVAGQGNLKAFA